MSRRDDLIAGLSSCLGCGVLVWARIAGGGDVRVREVTNNVRDQVDPLVALRQGFGQVGTLHRCPPIEPIRLISREEV
jgi:hypothetical protein